MGNREEAQAFMREMCSCTPKPLFHQVEEADRGTGFVLAYLERSDGEVIAGDLARELKVSTARIAALLNKLEEKGLAERSRSAHDARRTVVKITPAGAAYTAKIREQILDRVEVLFEKVGKEDLMEFLRICAKITKALDGENRRL